MKLYRVGEICRLTGLSRKHLFMYKHVVPPVATEYEGSYKLYDEAGFRKLEMIARLRQMGLHKPMILKVLEDPSQEKVLLEELKVHLKMEMQLLEERLTLVEEALRSMEKEEQK